MFLYTFYLYFLYIYIGSSETTREAPYTIQTSQIVLVKKFSFDEYVSPEHKKNIDFSFLEWFIGFSEGDACFYSRIVDTRVRLSFEIVQKDAKLIHKIRTTLGFGRVFCFTRNNQIYYKYVVGNKEGIQRIMLLFNGNFVLPKRYIQFARWVHVGKDICPPNFALKMQRVEVSLQTGWLAGFIEAEGCFYASFRAKQISNRGKYSTTDEFFGNKFSFDQKLTITQKDTHGESLVLQKILLLFQGTGKLHIAKKPNCYRIQFDSLQTQTNIVSYLEEFPLLGKKKIAFLRWWRIYLRRQKPEEKPISLKTVEKLKKLCLMINNTNTDVSKNLETYS
jgi:hypothetical protein